MLRSIPWDVWVAAALAVAVALVAVFETAAGAFMVMYGLLLAYIAVQIISDELAP